MLFFILGVVVARMGLLETVLSTFFGLIPLMVQFTLLFVIGSLYFLFWFNYVQKRTGYKWLGSAALSLFAGFFTLLFLMNIALILAGISSTNIEQIPPDVRENPLFVQSQRDVLSLLVSSFIQSILSSLILTLLLLPFAFLGVGIFDGLKPRVRDVWSRILFACFVGSLLFVLILSIFPWILVSLVYLTFFGI